MFLGTGMLAQYVAPKYGVPAGLALIVIGFILIKTNTSNKERFLLPSNPPELSPLPDYSKE
jgi:hypothetical protein